MQRTKEFRLKQEQKAKKRKRRKHMKLQPYRRSSKHELAEAV